jgi:hypothetical protein
VEAVVYRRRFPAIWSAPVWISLSRAPKALRILKVQDLE